MKAVSIDGIDSIYLRHMLEITADYSDLFSNFYPMINSFTGIDVGQEVKGSIEDMLKPASRAIGQKNYETIVNTVNSFQKLAKYDIEIRKETEKSYKTEKEAIDDYIKMLVEKEGTGNYLKRSECVSGMIDMMQDFCNPVGLAGKAKLWAGKKFISGWLESKKPGSGKEIEKIIKIIQENNDELDSLKEVIVKKEREYVKKIEYNGGK
jgi:hypothetical protein